METNLKANKIVRLMFCQNSQTPCIYYHINMKTFHFLSSAKHENNIMGAVMQLKEFLGVCDKEIELFSV